MALRSRQTERNAGKWLLECESEHVRANVLQGSKLRRKPQTTCCHDCLPVMTSSPGQSLSSFSCTHAAAQSCSCWPPPCLNSRKCPSVLCSYMLPPCKHVARKPAARAKHVERYGVCTRWGAEKTQYVSEQEFPRRKYFQARKRCSNPTQLCQVSSAPRLRYSAHGMVLFEFMPASLSE